MRDDFLTLREAILVSNGDLAKNALTAQEQAQVVGNPTGPSRDTIKFAIGNAVQTIQPDQAALPTIIFPVEIDGRAPAGMPNQVIVLAGDPQHPAGSNGLTLGKGQAGSANGSTIKGLTIKAFVGNGIELNDVEKVVLGGPNAADRNILILNKQSGVHITGTLAKENRLLNNYIGTDGMVKKQNDFYGVHIDNTASGNFIGDGDTAHRNVISGNGRDGIYIDDAFKNIVNGNYIGTNKDGTDAAGLGNGDAGVFIRNGSENVIGSVRTLNKQSLDDPANIISGNTLQGVRIGAVGGQTSAKNQVIGNYIGVAKDPDASKPLRPLRNTIGIHLDPGVG